MKFPRYYSAAQRLCILDMCENQSVKRVATQLKIHFTTIYKWKRNRVNIEAAAPTARRCGPQALKFHEQEQLVYEKVLDLRNNGKPVLIKSIIELMREAASTFKGSYAWAKKWMKAYGLSVRTPTQKIPEKNWKPQHEILQDLLPNLESFRANLNETPTWIDPPIRKTVDIIGKKDVMIKTVDPNQRRRITTILAVTEGGKMLQPCIIEQSSSKAAKTNPGSTRFMRGGIQSYKQPNHTNCFSIMNDWIRNVLAPQLPQHSRKLLIIDSASCHRYHAIKDAALEHNIDVLYIPPNKTKYLQPLDLTVNRSFKCKMANLHATAEKLHIPQNESFASCSLTRLCEQVKIATSSISPDCIKNGFRKMRTWLPT